MLVRNVLISHNSFLYNTIFLEREINAPLFICSFPISLTRWGPERRTSQHFPEFSHPLVKVKIIDMVSVSKV